MKKLYLYLFVSLFLTGNAFANQAVINMPVCNLSLDDFLYSVDAPAGTPVDCHFTFTSLISFVEGQIDLSNTTDWPAAVTTTEISYLEGVTSNIQTQIDKCSVDPVITCTNGQVLGTDCGSTNDFTCGFIVQIASGTVKLPAVATGYVGCVKATSAAAIYINPDDSDRFILDGTALDDGDQLDSAANIDATICFYADSAAGWTTFFNPHAFTDGN